ncbi:Rz1-like lysis system protein LysC [Lysobacter olei]
MHRFAVIACLLLAGCATCPIPKPPEVVEVVVTKTVPVDPKLARDCDRPAKRDDTVGEAARLANARDESLAECNKRLKAIRELAP